MNADGRVVLRGVSKTFPGQTALQDVDLTLDHGEVHALLGQNGSGKSTLIKILAGFHQPDAGAGATFSGASFELGSASAARDAGIRFIHQDLALVAEFNAIDNLALGSGYSGRRWISDRRERRAATALLDELGIELDVDVPVAQLGPAQRTMLAIARALRDGMASCRLLVLDEPTVSLTAAEVRHLFGLIARLRERGGTVLYVTHRLDEVFEIADRVTVLRDGVRVGTSAVGDLDHDALIELIVGRPLGEVYPDVAPAGEDVVLRVEGLGGEVVDDVSFEVRGGEILGIAGLVGSGREELPYLLYGARRRREGSVALDGDVLERLSPSSAVAAGIGFVSSDRKGESALPLFTLRENLTYPDLPVGRRTRWLSERAERADAMRWLRHMEVVPADPELPLASLSGGNQQKAVIARWLRFAPKLLIVDEPTQGVDVGAKAKLYSSLAEIAAAGTALVVFSSDSEELAAICDRVLVMRGGRVHESLGRASLSASAIDHLILQSERPRAAEVQP
jgi:ribose transport system ATP-binding protein